MAHEDGGGVARRGRGLVGGEALRVLESRGTAEESGAAHEQDIASHSVPPCQRKLAAQHLVERPAGDEVVTWLRFERVEEARVDAP